MKTYTKFESGKWLYYIRTEVVDGILMGAKLSGTKPAFLTNHKNKVLVADFVYNKHHNSVHKKTFDLRPVFEAFFEKEI